MENHESDTETNFQSGVPLMTPSQEGSEEQCIKIKDFHNIELVAIFKKIWCIYGDITSAWIWSHGLITAWITKQLEMCNNKFLLRVDDSLIIIMSKVDNIYNV